MIRYELDQNLCWYCDYVSGWSNYVWSAAWFDYGCRATWNRQNRHSSSNHALSVSQPAWPKDSAHHSFQSGVFYFQEINIVLHESKKCLTALEERFIPSQDDSNLLCSVSSDALCSLHLLPFIYMKLDEMCLQNTCTAVNKYEAEKLYWIGIPELWPSFNRIEYRIDRVKNENWFCLKNDNCPCVSL